MHVLWPLLISVLLHSCLDISRTAQFRVLLVNIHMSSFTPHVLHLSGKNSVYICKTKLKVIIYDKSKLGQQGFNRG